MKIATLLWEPVAGWSAPLPATDSESTLVLVFGDELLTTDRRPLESVRAAYPNSVIIGCSTAGQILGRMLHDRACVVAVADFEHTTLRKAAASVARASESFTAGASLGTSLAAPDLQAVFVLSNGVHVNGSDLVGGLVNAVGSDVVVTGGLAGDGDRFEHTFVIDDGSLSTDRVVAVGMYGTHLRIGTGSQGGWGIFGPERLVTRAEANVLYELDGQPALGLYKQYLGELAEQLPASALLVPLAVRADGCAEHLVRTVLSINEAEQSMTFAGDIPEGWRAQLMRANADRLVDGAATAGAMSAADLTTGAPDNGGPALNIAISCVGRRLVLGERTEEEIEATLDALPDHSELIGFYSYGEIAPGADGKVDLQNQTMTITTIREDSGS